MAIGVGARFTRRRGLDWGEGWHGEQRQAVKCPVYPVPSQARQKPQSMKDGQATEVEDDEEWGGLPDVSFTHWIGHYWPTAGILQTICWPTVASKLCWSADCNLAWHWRLLQGGLGAFTHSQNVLPVTYSLQTSIDLSSFLQAMVHRHHCSESLLAYLHTKVVKSSLPVCSVYWSGSQPG